MNWNDWPISRGWMLIIFGLVLLAIVFASITVISFARRQRDQETIAELRMEIEELRSEQAALSRAENPLSESLPETVRFLFPIHPEDFDHFTSPFGDRDDPLSESVGGENVKDHGGVDAVPFETVWNARVRPAAPGIVSIHWPPKGRPVPGHPGWTFKGDPERGAWIEILHDDGWRSRYLHLSWTNPETVHEGWRVDPEDTIGRVGGSGRTTGSHLHVELINPDGKRVNPLLHFQPEP